MLVLTSHPLQYLRAGLYVQHRIDQGRYNLPFVLCRHPQCVQIRHARDEDMMDGEPDEVDRLLPPHRLVGPHEEARGCEGALEGFLIRCGVARVGAEEEELREVVVEVEPARGEELVGLRKVAKAPLV